MSKLSKRSSPHKRRQRAIMQRCLAAGDTTTIPLGPVVVEPKLGVSGIMKVLAASTALAVVVGLALVAIVGP